MGTLLQVLNGILVGAVAALVILYGLRPKEPYPTWMLIPYDHPWVFLILLFIIGYVMMFHRLLGGLLLLLSASLYVDLVLFGRPTIFKRERGDVQAKEEKTEENAEHRYSEHNAYGVPLSDVELQEPNYPLFMGIDESQPGDPAPFE